MNAMTIPKTPNKHLRSSRFGLVMQKRLADLKLNPRRFSTYMDHAYDTIRKVYNGETFPGPNLLRDICKELKLDYDEMKELVELDRLIDKGWAETLLNEDPMITKFKVFWERLDAGDKQDLLDLAQARAGRSTKGGNLRVINGH
jgi:hypothetical protein